MAAALLRRRPGAEAPELLPVETLAPLLLVYQERLTRLAEDIDPGWLRRLEREDGLPPIPPGGAPARRSAALRARLRMATVAPDSFTAPAHRLAVLDKPALLRVLAARALFAHRAALGLCVDGAVLARLRALVGVAALAALRDAAQPSDPTADVAPLPAHADPLAWAVEGYGHFARDAVWRDAGLRRLIELALPADAIEAAEAAEAVPARPGDSDALLVLLPTLFPELTWLFG